MDLEEWLDDVGADAVKEFAHGLNTHGMSRADVVEYILDTPAARAQAEWSKRVMDAAREAAAARDPLSDKALRERYGLV